MKRRRARLVATTLVTVASIVSEVSMAEAKAAICAGVLNTAAVMPVICMLDDTTTTGTTTTGGVGASDHVGISEGVRVGAREGAAELPTQIPGK